MKSVQRLLVFAGLFVQVTLTALAAATISNQVDSSTQLAQLSPLYDNDPAPIHQWIAVNAWWKLTDPALKNEMSSYLPTSLANSLYSGSPESPVQIPAAWDDDRGTYSAPSTALIEGVWEEDENGYPVPALSSFNHFWDPGGAYDDGLFLPITQDRYQSALEVAQIFFNQAIAYYKFDKAASYYWLGRTAHLVMDMSVPAHVQLDQHFDGDNYENFTKSWEFHYKQIDNGSPNTEIPNFNDPPGADYPGSTPSHYDRKLTNLLYSIANFTDGFDSDDYDGGSPSTGGGKYRLYSNTIQSEKNFQSAYKIGLWPSTAQQRLLQSPQDYAVVDCDWSHDASINYSQSFYEEMSALPFGYGVRVYYDDNSSEVFWNWDVVNKKVPWAVCGCVFQPELQSRALAYTAALYQLFWARTHTTADLYEENDDCAHPYDLTSYWNYWLSQISGPAIHEDYDWYKISVPPGTQCLYVECKFKSSEGDIDVDLLDSSCNLLDDSNSDTLSTERICYQNPTPGIYLIKVYQFPYSENSYDLWWGSNCTEQVTLKTPPSGYRFSDCTPEIIIKWNLSDKLRRYEVQIDDSPDFSSPIELAWTTTTRDSAEACYEYGGMPPGTYYWRVKGQTKSPCNLYGDWSETWKLKVGCPNLAIGDPVTPLDGISGPLSVTFDWPALVQGTRGYEVWFDTVSSGFQHIWLKKEVPESQITLTIPPGDLYWQVRALCEGDCNDGPWKGPYLYLDVEDTLSNQLPSSFPLSQNFPNPFNPETTIDFTLPHSALVTLEIYDILGRCVVILVDEPLTPGIKHVTWNGRDSYGREVASGVYFYRLKAGEVTQSKKMLLLR